MITACKASELLNQSISLRRRASCSSLAPDHDVLGNTMQISIKLITKKGGSSDRQIACLHCTSKSRRENIFLLKSPTNFYRLHQKQTSEISFTLGELPLQSLLCSLFLWIHPRFLCQNLHLQLCCLLGWRMSQSCYHLHQMWTL
jgi:hypothetical protein